MNRFVDIDRTVGEVLSEMIRKVDLEKFDEKVKGLLFNVDAMYEKVLKLRKSVDAQARIVGKRFELIDDPDEIKSPEKEILAGFSSAAAGLEEVLTILNKYQNEQ